MKELSREDIVRAWRDPDVYRSLDETQRAALPAHPSGLVELSDAVLDAVHGGYKDSEGTHYSFCDPTADWCDDCKGDVNAAAS
ncbi:mersacidin/lichenicidin family type 2 lantibiotic [Pyxidicoccus sp. MSG2]|uniref:mersacidin/lichenicidin family type 2 lantibiotic n=1 Tax=Pyxidicoccus sp. MSG2 TaxID=2996790 RepID=UPI00226FF35F|nr:mersacidin/lichenicidin family type 2 lantibiotic [Pyxidicoccus sp. MSG2]MCY1017851.1 mersacidin/lichenicidin family type 2 lantibiotic [Pyxidicoccus sp. MSG2]